MLLHGTTVLEKVIEKMKKKVNIFKCFQRAFFLKPVFVVPCHSIFTRGGPKTIPAQLTFFHLDIFFGKKSDILIFFVVDQVTRLSE